LKKARTNKERQEIKRMIAQEMKKAKNDANGKLDDAKSDAAGKVVAVTKDGGPDIVKNDGNSATSDNVVSKGTELGRAKWNDAKAKLAQKEKDLIGKETLVAKGRARIASAKKRLAAAIASGNLTEDQIAKKQAMIDRAETGVDKLEDSIKGGKTAYAKQKASLSKVYKD
ncbi:MAG: hypothetical protein JKY22_05665, partial [Flavobacteriaceae bacterium]|nr:hypothetical protein [Flavobacteriaceae bacterium]